MKNISFTCKAFICFSIFVAQFAFAANWTITDRNEKLIVFMDLNSVRLTEKNLRQAWFLTDYNEVQKIDGYPQYKSFKELVKFDCKNGTMGTIKLILFPEMNGSGDAVFSEDRTLKLTAYVPDSIGESKFIEVCKLKLKK